MLSQTAEYALRAIAWLSSAPSEPQTTEAIAAGTGVPEGYLSKVLQSLRRAELVRSKRGITGGFVLGRSAEERVRFIHDEGC